ncbi:MAG: SAM-dependent methyltransferase [Proteobacteria bacterium]|nr:SAM-dependent methyltransferase [Pseudomonadota bacterium]
MTNGQLTLVGTGLDIEKHLTLGAKHAIESSEVVLYAINNARAEAYVKRLNSAARMIEYDRSQQFRRSVYEAMVETILAPVREGKKVCAVFYGHPNIFVYATNQAQRTARKEGHAVESLPGISAQDCLFADLGFDPATFGVRSHECTDFLLRPRNSDPHTGLILWQIGVIGTLGFHAAESRARGLSMLKDVLLDQYPEDHKVYFYVAATRPDNKPDIQRIAVGALERARITEVTTLYVPPIKAAPIDPAVKEALDITFHGEQKRLSKSTR